MVTTWYNIELHQYCRRIIENYNPGVLNHCVWDPPRQRAGGSGVAALAGTAGGAWEAEDPASTTTSWYTNLGHDLGYDLGYTLGYTLGSF